MSVRFLPRPEEDLQCPVRGCSIKRWNSGTRMRVFQHLREYHDFGDISASTLTLSVSLLSKALFPSKPTVPCGKMSQQQNDYSKVVVVVVVVIVVVVAVGSVTRRLEISIISAVRVFDSVSSEHWTRRIRYST